MFHSFFSSLATSNYLSLFFVFFDFHSVVGRDGIIITIIIIIIIIPWEFFTSALADGLAQVSESQQVSSSFQESPQYSDLS